MRVLILFTVAMENLGHMDLMGTQLTEQRIDQEGVKKCGQVLAMLHKKTLKANNTAVEWEELEKKFRYVAMKHYKPIPVMAWIHQSA